MRFKRKRKIANAKIYEDKRDLYCTYLVNDLQISDLQGENSIDLPGIYTKDRIPVNHSQIPVSEDISRWEHLTGVVLPTVDAKIGIFLGNNIPDAYTPLEVKIGLRGSPHAARTLQLVNTRSFRNST